MLAEPGASFFGRGAVTPHRQPELLRVIGDRQVHRLVDDYVLQNARI